MDEVEFCPDCGRLEKYCICDIEIEYLDEGTETFRFEWAHEACTELNSSVFKTILPIYE